MTKKLLACALALSLAAMLIGCSYKTDGPLPEARIFEGDFETQSWGATIDEVRGSGEIGKGYPVARSNAATIKTEAAFQGQPCDVFYMFSDKQLVAGGYMFEPETQDQQELFLKLYSALEEELGQPGNRYFTKRSDPKPMYSDGFEEHMEEILAAINEGDGQLTADFENDGTRWTIGIGPAPSGSEYKRPVIFLLLFSVAFGEKMTRQ